MLAEDVYQRMSEKGLAEIVGGGDTQLVAAQSFTALRYLTQLEPQMSVLDFGCGCGRLAIPLLEYLSEEGSYVGVDIVPKLVEFCNQEIEPFYSNASFFRSTDSNKLYDKFVESNQVSIPTINDLEELGNKRFDVICAFSVFTHLTMEDAQKYFVQLTQLLRPGGKLIVSCLLINESSRNLIRNEKSAIRFGVEVQEDQNIYFIDDNLTAVAFQDQKFISLAMEAGLDPLITYYGQWCGRQRRRSYQDIMVFSDVSILPANFNAEEYLRMNPDLPWKEDSEGLLEAEKHFLEHGYCENRSWN